jgi:Flp pilus assembly protein TadG
LVHPFSRLKPLARAFACDRRGNMAIVFALCLVPILAFIGAAIDMGNAQRMRAQLQDATDSAVLAVARDGLRLTDGQIKTAADTYMKASYRYLKQAPFTITTLTFDRTSVTAVLNTKATVSTSFLQIVGIRTLPITAHAVSKGLGFEVAMVLDTSGSMDEYAGSTKKIDALKTAGDSFLDSMFGNQATSQRVSISVVPFAASVRVLPAGSAAPSWLDTTGAATNAFDDLATTSSTYSRWKLFSQMSLTTWGGCVMTRNPPDDVTDSSASGATLFEPWFAPDEPDDANAESTGSGWFRSTATYRNDYLNDSDGNCSGSTYNKSAVWFQERVCKSKSERVRRASGPNYLCDSPAITPLTNTKATLSTAIDNLDAAGNTNILEGLMWGWRSLSPTAPFTEGKAYTAANNRKVIILMTDGQNNYGAGSYNQNYGEFFSYGYAKHGHIGQTSSDNNTLNGVLDTKTMSACTNAKAKGIVIYTIGFGSGAKASQSLLKGCASDPSYFYEPATSADLKPVFLAIAQSINRLRIAE